MHPTQLLFNVISKRIMRGEMAEEWVEETDNKAFLGRKGGFLKGLAAGGPLSLAEMRLYGLVLKSSRQRICVLQTW